MTRDEGKFSASTEDVPPGALGVAVRRSARLATWIVIFLVLLWAFRASGLSGAGKLWSNRDKAVNMVLGQPVDESTRAARRAELVRELRVEFQEKARAEIRAEYVAAGKVPPGIQTLIREAQVRAKQQIEALAPGEFDRVVVEKLVAEGLSGTRRGGFLPPETDLRRVIGDPATIDTSESGSSLLTRTLVAWGDGVGGVVRGGVRWIVVAFTGNGYVGELLETIAIAMWGTLLAVVIALPVALLASDRGLQILNPGGSIARGASRFVSRFAVRRSFDVARGFNEVVLAMIFVAVLGLGPLPGVIALLVHTYGVLGKIFADAIDAIEVDQVEGVLSTGASSGQVIIFAVWPQILPYVVSQSLLRFESNVRGATILGVVGAGGIGQLLMDKFGAYAYPEVASMMLIVILAVTAIDMSCGWVMRRVV